MFETGIYIITNHITNKCYIGSAVNISRRWRQHRSDLKLQKHDNSYLQRVYNKYGKNCFTFDILCYCSINNLIYFEQKCIDLLKPEYNLNKNVSSMLGFKHSDATKKKLSESHKGQIPWCKGKTNVFSKETLEKMSLAKKGKDNHCTGRVVSKETREKISAKLKINNLNKLIL